MLESLKLCWNTPGSCRGFCWLLPEGVLVVVGLSKAVEACNCVPMLRDAFCSWCNHAGDYTFLCHALACMFLNEGEP